MAHGVYFRSIADQDTGRSYGITGSRFPTSAYTGNRPPNTISIDWKSDVTSCVAGPTPHHG